MLCLLQYEQKYEKIDLNGRQILAMARQSSIQNQTVPIFIPQRAIITPPVVQSWAQSVSTSASSASRLPTLISPPEPELGLSASWGGAVAVAVAITAGSQ